MEKVINMIQTIDEWARKEPQRPVYLTEEKVSTYGELKEKSDNLAAYLAELKTDKSAIVVYGELDFEMIVSFLGASKAGFSYIPIDAHTPKERIELILNVAKPTAVIAVHEWPELATEVPVITAEELTEMMMHAPRHAPALIPVTGASNYYIIFTSGTTGVPKGVQISHDNLVSFTNWLLQDFGLEEGARFLAQAPYSFDLSVMSIYPALALGGSLTPLPNEIINDFKQLFTRLPQLTIDVWVSTPSFIELCLMEPSFDGEHLPALRTFLFCGEELPKPTAEKLAARFPTAHIYNTYGPTEATVAISAIEITQEVLKSVQRLPIGYVKEDTQIYIMEGMSKLPAGEIGEIVIAGPSVSKGYLNNPAKTAEAFFQLDGVLAYRTGDAGKLVDNLLQYEGRLDFQIKLHGYRIELEEVDHHLTNVSYVKQAVVVPKYQGNKVQQLIAYVVPQAHEFSSDFQLTKAIKQELATLTMDYMIPQKFVYVEQLPLTSNGKIDRKGLMNEVNAT